MSSGLQVEPTVLSVAESLGLAYSIILLVTVTRLSSCRLWSARRRLLTTLVTADPILPLLPMVGPGLLILVLVCEILERGQQPV